MHKRWLIHVDIWQKPTQHCKAIILQLKINKFFKFKKKKKDWRSLHLGKDRARICTQACPHPKFHVLPTSLSTQKEPSSWAGPQKGWP